MPYPKANKLNSHSQCIIAAALLGNVNITKEKKREGDEGYGDNVTHGFFLSQLFRSRPNGTTRADADTDTEKSNGGAEKQAVGKPVGA